MKSHAVHGEKLRARGLRSTPQGRELLAILTRAKSPATAKVIHQSMRVSRCDLATVHRLLVRLEAAGLVRSTPLQGTSRWYELQVEGSHHHHLFCTCCHKIEPFDFCDVDTFQKVLDKKSGFKILSHALELYGLCRKCRPQKETSR